MNATHAPAARGVARCEAVTGKVAAIFGFVPVICQRVVGVATWTDTEGFEHSACGSHVRDMERRYPMGEPGWLHEDPEYADDMTFAKWTADREEART